MHKVKEFLKKVAEIHDIDEYDTECQRGCKACEANALLKEIDTLERQIKQGALLLAAERLRDKTKVFRPEELRSTGENYGIEAPVGAWACTELREMSLESDI